MGHLHRDPPNLISHPEPSSISSAIYAGTVQNLISFLPGTVCAGTLRNLICNLHQNSPELHQFSAPKPSGTSSTICAGTLRKLVCYLHRNPPELHQPAAPELSGTSSAICTGTLRNLISNLHRKAPEPSGTFSGTWCCSCTGSHQSFSGLKTPSKFCCWGIRPSIVSSLKATGATRRSRDLNRVRCSFMPLTNLSVLFTGPPSSSFLWVTFSTSVASTDRRDSTTSSSSLFRQIFVPFLGASLRSFNVYNDLCRGKPFEEYQRIPCLLRKACKKYVLKLLLHLPHYSPAAATAIRVAVLSQVDLPVKRLLFDRRTKILKAMGVRCLLVGLANISGIFSLKPEALGSKPLIVCLFWCCLFPFFGILF